MISNEILSRFIYDVSVDDNTFEVIGQAFVKIGEIYRIAEVKASLFAPVTYCSTSAKSKEMLLYKQQAEVQKESAYREEYITREEGRVILDIYRLAGESAFTDEEKADLKPILDIIYMHCEKWKMINLVRDIGKMDSLTGLPNSGGFLSYIDEQLKIFKDMIYH